MRTKATAALDACENQIKAKWSEELKSAYSELATPSDDSDDLFTAAEREFAAGNAQRVKQADDEAYRVRMAAEDTLAKPNAG